VNRRRPYLAVLTVTVNLEAALSLKDKRMVVRSLKDGLRARFGATVAEVDGLDERRHGVVVAAALATSRADADTVLARLARDTERRFGGHDLSLAGEVAEL